MKLKTLAKTPQLVKIEIASEDIIDRYGEPVEFWIYDRYEMDTYLKLLNSDDRDFTTLSGVIKQMVMDEDGTPIFKNGEIIPPDVLAKMVEEVINYLGNSIAQTFKK